MLPEEICKLRLHCWREKFKATKDQDGRPLFTRDTEKASKEQESKVQFITDHPAMNPYREIPPGPRSKHGLSTWLSKRPESHLENFHKSLAHFANTNMNPGLSDCLSIRGGAENNVAIRHDLATAEQKGIFEKTPPMPEYISQHPPIQDHLLMVFLNKKARELGLNEPFTNVRPLPEDNGEVFLTEYYYAQAKRNSNKDITMTNTRRCLCNQCSGNPEPYVDEEVDVRESTVTQQQAPAAVYPPPPPLAQMPTAQVPVQRLVALPAPQPPTMGHFLQCRPVKVSWCQCPKNIAFYERQARTGNMKGRPSHDRWCLFKDWERQAKIMNSR
jgi:hypothetical protein